MAVAHHKTLFLNGPAGQLEALLWTPPRDSCKFAAVICHPHPLFGGTMHNKVVFHAAKALHSFGMPVLRFNFRGVGLSAGTHDAGRGEQGDVRAAVDFLAAEYSGRKLLLAGFSFGSVVGLRAGCADSRIAALIAMGLPVNDSDFTFLKYCAKPKLAVQSSNDQFGSAEKLKGVWQDAAEPKQLVFVEAPDHFFAGKLEEMSSAIRDWFLARFPSEAS